jgi:preprotein translocase subunit SecA
MEVLSRLWDKATDLFTAFSEGLVRIGGSPTERKVRKMRPLVAAINELEPAMMALSEEELRAKTTEFRQRRAAGVSLDDLLREAFAACREAGRRHLDTRHFDVQLMGGMVLHGGNIAEMVTGEGKTLMATLAAYLNALDGHGVHVVTVNDYLARRDAEWMSPLFRGLGMTVAATQAEMDSRQRQEIYACDITYGSNNEFGFDYLRDNMKPTKELQGQRKLHYAIIDEVGSILIDEARTPLVISGPLVDNTPKYAEADRIARSLKRDLHFDVKEKERTCHLTDGGVEEAEQIAGLETFNTRDNRELPHLIDNALKAHHLYRRDRDYVVQPDGEVVIVDGFTGRLMIGREWSDGLHRAVEAKERVRIKEENQTLATITVHNFFKLYQKLSGMTGTAITDANEFYELYSLSGVAIPTERPPVRINHPDLVFRYKREKIRAIIEEIQYVHETGRPILVGTSSIEKSEELSELLRRFGVDHQILNAENHEREAEMVAQAGRMAAVTIATNLAGRRTDIVLGGNPELMAWADLRRQTDQDGRPLYPTRLEVPRELWAQAVARYEPEMKAEGRKVAALGGVYTIGTERHDSRRIDNELCARSGREGDPGSSRFFLSLEDDLSGKIWRKWVSPFLTRMGVQEGQAIQSRWVSRLIERAQKKVEKRNFDSRKNLLEYDEVMEEQRKRVHSLRQDLLEGARPKDLILQMLDDQIVQAADRFLAADYRASTFAEWAAQRLRAKAKAQRQLHERIRQAIGENLPVDTEPSEWAWPALTDWANGRIGLNLTERDLKEHARSDDELHFGRHAVEEFLIEQATASREEIDLEQAREFLLPDWGRRSLSDWIHHKFGVAFDSDLWADQDRAENVRRIQAEARRRYSEKEAEFPLRIATMRLLADHPGDGNVPRPDCEGLAEWFATRYQVKLDVEELRHMLRSEIESHLIALAHQHFRGPRIERELDAKLAAARPTVVRDREHGSSSDPKAAADLAEWARRELDHEIEGDEIANLRASDLRARLGAALDAKYRPEMREVETPVILQILDSSWVEHLHAMARLRSSVGLEGNTQTDPKVEYKREGMRIFSEMWNGVGDRITDLIFRVEQFDPEFLDYVRSRCNTLD